MNFAPLFLSFFAFKNHKAQKPVKKRVFCDINGTLLNNPTSGASEEIIAFLETSSRHGHTVSIISDMPSLEMVLEEEYGDKIAPFLPVCAKSSVGKCDLLIDDNPEIQCKVCVNPQSQSLVTELKNISKTMFGFAFKPSPAPRAMVI